MPLPKPNKPQGPVKNLRPVIRLNTVRKALSLIMHRRTRARKMAFLGPVQSGFRPGRSTYDVLWCLCWLASRAQRFHWQCHGLGLYLSRAFGPVDRRKLLEVMRGIVLPDELCIIHLLCSTTLVVQLEGATSDCFTSTIGTPQGDGLSPLLFLCYLEAALRQCRQQFPERPLADSTIPHETGYADDVTLMSTSKQWLQLALPIIDTYSQTGI